MNRALTVILATVALDAIGIGLILPILPGLLRELAGTHDVAVSIGLLSAVYALMQFLLSPLLGALSDRFGRRPVLLASLAGAAVDYVVMALAPNLSILFVSRAIAGMTGANMTVATAYIADVSSEDVRSRRFGLMNACFGIGFVLGPALGGLIGGLSLRAPFLVAAGLNGLNFLVGAFVLPESHRTRSPIQLRGLLPLTALRWAAGAGALLPLMAVFFLLQLVGQTPATLWVIYGQDRFGWSTGQVGLSLAGFGLLHALSQAFLTGPVTTALGERRSLLLGIGIDAAAYVLLALASQGWMAFCLIPLFAVGSIGLPALQSLLSRQVSNDEQGKLQGTLVSLTSLAAIVGPPTVAAAYAQSAGIWPGLVWLASAMLYGLCLPLLLRRQNGDGSGKADHRLRPRTLAHPGDVT